MDYGRFLVISLGTGRTRVDNKYTCKKASKWGVLDWLIHGGSSPLVHIFSQAMGGMVDFHNSVVFQALHSEGNYLRIQDDTLTGTESSVDIATEDNLDRLVRIRQSLSKKKVSRLNLVTGLSEPVENAGTNEDALKGRFAVPLSNERRLRELRSPVQSCNTVETKSINFEIVV